MDGYDVGLGLLGGLQNAVGSYYDAEKENNKNKQALGLLKVEKGIIPDGKGGYIKDPEFQKKTNADAIRDAALKGEVIVEDPVTHELVNKGYNPDRLNQQIQIQSGKAAATAKAVAEADPDRPLKRDKLIADVKKAQKDAAAAPGSADEKKAAGFTKRLEQANEIFDSLEKDGYDRSSDAEAAKAMVGDYLPANMKGKLGQQDQAERNFVNSVLRRESGSAIQKDEFTSAEKQYFPRRGDTPEVKAQKAANRAQAILNLKNEAGQAYAAAQSAGTGLIKKEASKPQGLLKPGAPPQTKEWGGKKYEMQGDHWVEVK